MKLLLPKEFAPILEPKLSSDPSIQIAWVDSHGNIEGDSSDAEVYFNWFYLKPDTLRKVLAASPKLKWHQAPSAGVNHILIPEYLEREIILTNGAGTFSIPIAEFVLTYILYHAKSLPKLFTLQANYTWQKSIELPIQELSGATLLIIGAGSIGREIAKRASAFGMRVWGSRRKPELLPNFEQIVGADEWRSLLPEADYVVLATPLTPETKHLMDESALRAMHSNAYLINIARGAVVDESALITALKEGWIAGAGLDTFETEPLPSNSPLWSLPNVFITPHCSGYSPRIPDRMIALFLDNLDRYRTGRPLRNVVDKLAEY
ncbi:D-2-hydroxyacid dehydrogenase [Leptolyngbya sp. NIES-2104]|uniref:D-2-hydroxyacid dehydrogenase n=1 Tax=Leptolyngbya sp. NIES-2104 TaxID=1552121 RepID=UPI0006ECB7BE|nr:D-2-hydroxyacid dehydrogenase [Leptolyngbya sp. NIES-2104]GAP94446.1 D-3-phosphoglycerate dehydrogenase [Leptolyngbya sp. NIES-2104]